MNSLEKANHLDENANLLIVRHFTEGGLGTHKAYFSVDVTRKDGIHEVIGTDIPNLHTTDGVDFTHYQCYTATVTGVTSSISTATIGSNYLCLSSDTGSPNAGDHSVASEINNNHGLNRAQCSTRTHTAGTNVTTLANTFTASGASFTAVQKGGLLNASSSGVLNHEFTFASTNLNDGDSITITITCTGG